MKGSGTSQWTALDLRPHLKWDLCLSLERQYLLAPRHHSGSSVHHLRDPLQGSPVFEMTSFNLHVVNVTDGYGCCKHFSWQPLQPLGPGNMRSEQTSRSSPTLGSISCLTDLVAHHQLYQSWLFLVAYHPRFLEGSTFDLQFFHGCFLVGGLHVPVSALAECFFHGYHWYCELYLGPLASKHRWILSHFHQSFSRSGSFDRQAFSARKETVESPGPVEQWTMDHLHVHHCT